METMAVGDVLEVMPVSTLEAKVRFAARGKQRGVEAYAAAVLRRGVEA